MLYECMITEWYVSNCSCCNPGSVCILVLVIGCDDSNVQTCLGEGMVDLESGDIIRLRVMFM